MTQTTLEINTTELIDRLWRKAAERECRFYSEHFETTEVIAGHTVCFNCGGLA